jgi:hypothetical protein
MDDLGRSPTTSCCGAPHASVHPSPTPHPSPLTPPNLAMPPALTPDRLPPAVGCNVCAPTCAPPHKRHLLHGPSIPPSLPPPTHPPCVTFRPHLSEAGGGGGASLRSSMRLEPLEPPPPPRSGGLHAAPPAPNNDSPPSHDRVSCEGPPSCLIQISIPSPPLHFEVPSAIGINELWHACMHAGIHESRNTCVRYRTCMHACMHACGDLIWEKEGGKMQRREIASHARKRA